MSPRNTFAKSLDLLQDRMGSGVQMKARARWGFVDIARAAGIRFVHSTGAFGKKYLPETMGPGCGFVDYYNDGDAHIILGDGRDFTSHRPRGTTLSSIATTVAGG